MWEKLKKVRPFWWFVAFFIVINVLWIGPSFLGTRTLPRGTPAPEFSLPLVGSATERLSLDDLRGRTVVLVFWATWCDACVSELPVVSKVAGRHAQDGLAVVGMNLEPESRAGVARFLDSLSVGYPNVTVDGSTAEAYRVKMLPAIYVIDADGRICNGFAGRTGRMRLERAISSCMREGAG